MMRKVGQSSDGTVCVWRCVEREDSRGLGVRDGFKRQPYRLLKLDRMRKGGENDHMAGSQEKAEKMRRV